MGKKHLFSEGIQKEDLSIFRASFYKLMGRFFFTYKKFY
jgi:hypothetical protein